jgi:hypothetical protein
VDYVCIYLNTHVYIYIFNLYIRIIYINIYTYNIYFRATYHPGDGGGDAGEGAAGLRGLAGVLEEHQGGVLFCDGVCVFVFGYRVFVVALLGCVK